MGRPLGAVRRGRQYLNSGFASHLTPMRATTYSQSISKDLLRDLSVRTKTLRCASAVPSAYTEFASKSIRADFGEPTSEPILRGRLADYWSPKRFRGRC